MKKAVLFLILLFIVNLLVAQEKGTGKLPNEQSQVNREYDENGDLIRFDSIYVKSWSLDSTMHSWDMEELQKELKNRFGSSLHSFFSDSTSSGNDPFQDMEREFFQHRNDRMSGFSFDKDSGNWEGFFPDNLDSLHEKIMKHFGHFFKMDSLRFQFKNDRRPDDFDFFFNPEELEKMRKEMEEQFDQPMQKENEIKKMGAI